MPEAARKSDMTVHGDPLDPGPASADVSVQKKRAWRAVVDSHLCTKIPSDGAEICPLGSMTVLINKNMAVRQGDFLTGAGAPNAVARGANHVIIGDIRMGLWNPANVAEFCRDMCKLKENWAKMTPDERKKALEDAINKQLAKSGVPRVGVNPTALPGGTMGQLDFQTWNLDVDDSLFNKASLSTADMQGLGNTIYHEARHAEQWYGMAQVAGPGAGSAAQLSTDMAIPQNVADSAFANPAAAGSYQSVFGDTMYRSVYGPNGTYRNNVLTSLGQSPTPPNAYDQYRALPEETDAWRVGDAMNSCKCPKKGASGGSK